MLTLKELAARFTTAKETSAGYDVQCPAHQDSHASLSIGVGKSGGLVLKCHAGCDVKAILGKLDLKWADVCAQRVQITKHVAAEKIRESKAYSYRNAAGAEVYQVVRYEPKTFRQRRAAQAGEPARNGWVWSLKGVAMVLYRLPEVLAAAKNRERIYVVEGEKDADNLTALGVCATSAPGGADAKWREEYTASLAGASEVVVIPDADAAGDKHAKKVLAALNAGRVPTRLLKLPGKGKDASDWIAAGGTAVDLAGLVTASDLSAVPLRAAEPTDKPGPAPLRDLGKNFETACRLIRDDTARGLLLWPGSIGFNLMAGQPEIGGRPLEDHHVAQIRELAAQQYSLPGGGQPLHLAVNDVRDAVERVAHEREFHPVEVWLRGLPFAGTGHIERIGRVALGLEDPHELATLRRWFIAAVARPLRPGCQVDSTLVLYGAQAVRKTTFFRTLAGEWYGSGPIRPEDKDTLYRVHRSWIYEWAELAAISKRTLEELRDFMTTTVDRWVPKYGRAVAVRPRRTVFSGTTNDQHFLNDPAGNRRFWPVHVQRRIDTGIVADLREAAFAEAKAALESGERWWLEWDEEQAQAQHSEQFREQDPWYEDIDRWLGEQWECAGQYNCFTTREIASGAVSLGRDKMADREAKRIATVLRHLGWLMVWAKFDGRAMRVWIPKDTLRADWHRPPDRDERER